MNANVLFYVIIAILVVDYVLERILDSLNARMRHAELPREVADIYDKVTYEKQQRYEQAKSKIGFWSSTVGFVLIMALLLTGCFGILD